MVNQKLKSKQLIQAAFYDLLKKKDFESISIKEICEAAGVSRMSFYRYYSTKEDVFVVIFDETFDRFFQKISHDPSLSIKDMLLIFFNGLYHSHDQIDILKKAQKESILLGQFEQYASYIGSKMNLSLMRDGFITPFSTPFFAGGLFNVVIRWSNRNYQETPEEMTEVVMHLFNLIN